MNTRKSIFSKVLHIGPDLAGQGGMATVLAQYKLAMPAFRHCAVNSSRGGLRSKLAMAAAFARIPWHRLTGARIAHIHYASGKSWRRENWLASWARLWGFRTVMHCHCNFVAMTERHGSATVKQKLSAADANIVLARDFRTYGKEKLGLENITVIPNFVNDSSHVAHTPVAAPLTFIFMGLLSRPKGFLDLLKAMRAVYDEAGPQFKVIAAGRVTDSAVTDYLEAWPQHKAVLEMPGWLTGVEKDAAMARAHVVVLPSYTEGQPMCILEGLQAGKATIATRVGAVPDMVKQDVNGYLLEPGDTAALTAAMKSYVASPELAQKHGREALRQAAQFTPEAIMHTLEDLYFAVSQK